MIVTNTSAYEVTGFVMAKESNFYLPTPPTDPLFLKAKIPQE
jgi:hypothetical protein